MDGGKLFYPTANGTTTYAIFVFQLWKQDPAGTIQINDLLFGIKTDYVSGTYWGRPEENGQSHMWLVVNKHIIIDITGNQFSDRSIFFNYDKSVYVGDEGDPIDYLKWKIEIFMSVMA